MILDYNERQRLYTLTVKRGEDELTPNVLMREYGLDYSVPSSTHAQGVLYTDNPYAAVTFIKDATPAAAEKLAWISEEVAASQATSSLRHIEQPADKQLEPFQCADVDYILRREHALDADEPGLGKTPTAICVANEMQAQRVIVVCPANIRLQWERRIREWSTQEKPHVYPVLSSKNGVNVDAEWTIVSYDLARVPAILRALVKGTYDLGIFDEVHYAKEIESKRARACFGYYDRRADDGESLESVSECIAARCKRLLLLSGTPLPNRPREIYPIARAACWDAIGWMSQKRFNERFNPVNRRQTTTNKIYTEEKVGREAELQNRLRAHFMTRHLDKDVRVQMHYPVYDLIHVHETHAVKLALEAERLLDFDPDFLEGADLEILGQVATVRRQMGEAIAPQAAAYVRVLIEGGEKLVIFAWHVSVLSILQAELAHLGCVRIDGRDTASSKEAKVGAFRHRPDIRVLIGNSLSLGVGTDGLQDVCHHGLIVEPDWVPGNNVQCFKRLDRMGQTNQVFGEIFVAPNSIAERILAGALRKGTVIEKALDRQFSEPLLW